MKKITIILLVVFFVATLTACGGDNGNLAELQAQVEELTAQMDIISAENESLKKDLDSARKTIEDFEAAASAELEAAKAEPIELSNGNYIAGTDFPAGTYTITAIEGHGNVSSDNMFSGGLNAVMGVEEDDFYSKEYKNIELPEGVTLTINGPTVQLTYIR